MIFGALLHALPALTSQNALTQEESKRVGTTRDAELAAAGPSLRDEAPAPAAWSSAPETAKRGRRDSRPWSYFDALSTGLP